MNYNRNVVVFTLVTTFILFIYSLFASVTNFHFLGLDNISIVADVLTARKDTLVKKEDTVSITPAVAAADMPTGPVGPRSLAAYKQYRTITDFSTDTSAPALRNLMHRLYELKQSHKGKVRIAWLGDSFIEGDQLTKTVRAQLQQYFGGMGVGYVPVTSVTNAGFRTTVSQKWNGDWREENFKSASLAGPLFLSGRCYYTANGSLNMKDLTPGKDSTQKLEKSLICGYEATPAGIVVNGQPRQVIANKRFNRILLDSSTSHSLDITVQDEHLPVYGVSFEPQNGVVVDNFSFRGISGEELGKMDTSFLRIMQEESRYDLVILEYGVNVLYRPDNTDFSWHKRNMTRVLAKLSACLPNTEFLVISTSDRGFRYPEGSRSATGVSNLVKTQAELSYENGMAFFNMFTSMGGEGTIVRWADSTPVLAGHDYVHPNTRGSEILGNMFYEALMKDYAKATSKKTSSLINTNPGDPVAANK